MRIATDNTYLYGEQFIGMAFQGYGERNYGKSALYAGNDLTIDASALPHGITIAWAGGDSNRARVPGVFGNLTMNNVTITGGYSMAGKFGPLATDWTPARGGACAVWGMATLSNCTLAVNLDDFAGMLILLSPMAWLRAHCIRRIRTSISFRSRRSSTIREVSVSPKW